MIAATPKAFRFTVFSSRRGRVIVAGWERMAGSKTGVDCRVLLVAGSARRPERRDGRRLLAKVAWTLAGLVVSTWTVTACWVGWETTSDTKQRPIPGLFAKEEI